MWLSRRRRGVRLRRDRREGQRTGARAGGGRRRPERRARRAHRAVRRVARRRRHGVVWVVRDVYAQLLNQAPFDLFLSADLQYPNELAARGLTLPQTEFTYAIGRLVLWAPAGSSLEIERDGVQALTAASIAHVAIANPEHAPYGRAAVAAMESAGVYDRLRPKLVLGENVAQAMQFAQSGAADAAIVALSLALAPNAKGGRASRFPLPPTHASTRAASSCDGRPIPTPRGPCAGSC